MVEPEELQRIHRRYLEQASWTSGVRRRLLERVTAGGVTRLLEVGAGTGAIAAELASAIAGTVFALDIDPQLCLYGAKNAPRSPWIGADAHALPLQTSSFDAAAFHYVLLWLEDPAQALAEAVRVTRPGGWILAFAEPDHACRIDFPQILARLGERQTEALAAQGADVRMGRKLRALFSAAGLAEITAGVFGGEWNTDATPGPSAPEWETLRADLAGRVPAADLDALEDHDRDAWQRGERVLFVPTFFAAGRVL